MAIGCEADTAAHEYQNLWLRIDVVWGCAGLLATLVLYVLLLCVVPATRLGGLCALRRPVFALFGCIAAHGAVLADGMPFLVAESSRVSCRLRLALLYLCLTLVLSPVLGRAATMFRLRRQAMLPSFRASWDASARRVACGACGVQLAMLAAFLGRFMEAESPAPSSLTSCTDDWSELAFHIVALAYLGALLLATAFMLVHVRRVLPKDAANATEMASCAATTGLVAGTAVCLALSCVGHASPALLPFRFAVLELLALHQVLVHLLPPVARHLGPRLREAVAGRRRLHSAFEREMLEETTRKQHVLVSELEAQLEEARAALKDSHTRLRLMTSPLLQARGLPPRPGTRPLLTSPVRRTVAAGLVRGAHDASRAGDARAARLDAAVAGGAAVGAMLRAPIPGELLTPPLTALLTAPSATTTPAAPLPSPASSVRTTPWSAGRASKTRTRARRLGGRSRCSR